MKQLHMHYAVCPSMHTHIDIFYSNGSWWKSFNNQNRKSKMVLSHNQDIYIVHMYEMFWKCNCWVFKSYLL